MIEGGCAGVSIFLKTFRLYGVVVNEDEIKKI